MAFIAPDTASFLAPKAPTPYYTQSHLIGRSETIFLRQAFERLLNSGMPMATAAKRIYEYYHADVTRASWYRECAVVQVDNDCVEVGECDECVNESLSTSSVEPQAVVRDSVVSASEASVERVNQVTAGSKSQFLETVTYDHGYCYLLLYKPECREYYATKHRAYPRMSSLLGADMNVWDIRGLSSCGIRYGDYDDVHIFQDGDGQALQFLMSALAGNASFGLQMQCGAEYRHGVDYYLGGKSEDVGSIGDKAVGDVLQALVNREVSIPIVYVSSERARPDAYGELDNDECVAGELQASGLRLYTYNGHTSRSLVILEPGQFMQSVSVLVGSDEYQVGVVLPARVRTEMYQREGVPSECDGMEKHKRRRVLLSIKPRGLRLKVVALTPEWNSSHLGLRANLTDVTFAFGHSDVYLHYTPYRMSSMPTLNTDISVQLDDPFDDEVAVGDIRHTVSHDGALAVSLRACCERGVAVVDTFRALKHGKYHCVVSGVFHIEYDDAAVSVNVTDETVISLVSKTNMRLLEDDFSFHVKRVKDVYLYDVDHPHMRFVYNDLGEMESWLPIAELPN